VRSSGLAITVLICLAVASCPRDGASAGASDTPLRDKAINWLMAGDSYSSGQGIDDNVGECARSTEAYADNAYNRLGGGFYLNWSEDIVACSGDVINNFSLQAAEAALHFSNMPFDPSSLSDACRAQLDTVAGEDWADAIIRGTDHFALWRKANCSPETGRYDIISFTFGGNDIGFPSVLKGCIVGTLRDAWADVNPGLTKSCPSEKTIHDRIAKLANPGGVIYDRAHNIPGVSYAEFLRQVARDYLAPGGRLYVAGYPHMFAPSDDWPWYDLACQGFDYPKADMLGRLARYLNTTILRQVEAAHASDGRIRFVSVIDDFKNGGHELCGHGQDWINGLTVGPFDPAESFHTNRAGNDEEGSLLADAIKADPPLGSDPPTTGPTETTSGPTPTGSVNATTSTVGTTTSDCTSSDMSRRDSSLCEFVLRWVRINRPQFSNPSIGFLSVADPGAFDPAFSDGAAAYGDVKMVATEVPGSHVLEIVARYSAAGTWSYVDDGSTRVGCGVVDPAMLLQLRGEAQC
jgi:GDSL-like Lipase/Acylhydrolase family